MEQKTIFDEFMNMSKEETSNLMKDHFKTMEQTIDINELLDEGYVIGKIKIFIEQEMDGDMVEEVISMIWDDEYNYGNPHNLTEQEHDNLVHSYVENIIWKESLISKISQMTKQDSSFYSKNNIEELEKKFWELKKNQ
jgi:hypothetical protein